jgi:hypothetical protein
MSELLPFTDVNGNSWFACALLFLVRFGVVGACWSWALVCRNPGASPWSQWLVKSAATLLCGILINVISAVLLAELGIYSTGVEWFVLAAAAGLGRFLAVRKSVAWSGHVRDCLPVFAMIAVMGAVIMLVPGRGAWIAGGWDPGIYVNQGIAVSHAGSFHSGPEAAWSRIGADGFQSISRERGNPFPFHEYLPVVPINPETGEIRPFFFRGMPAFVAVLERCGGLRAATRANLFAGWIALGAFAALCAQLLATSAARWMAIAVLIAHPVWWFMAHFPTSEMLQLAVVAGAVAWIPALSRGRSAGIFIAALLLLGMLNRFSFLPFAALLLCTISWIGIRFDQPGRFSERLIQVCAVSGGAIFALVCCSVTLDRLGDQVQPLWLTGAPLLTLSLALELGPVRRQAKRFAAHPSLPGYLLLLVAALLAAKDWFRGPDHAITAVGIVGPALPYLGHALLLGSLAGMLLMLTGRNAEKGIVVTVMWFYTAAIVATISTTTITMWLPFAARRHLVYSLPCIALFAGILFATLWQWTDGRKALRVLILIPGLALPLANIERAWHAITRTEFEGLPDMLANVARNIEPGDIVVADHYKWGTPLRFLFGAAVLNGETLWKKDSTPEKRTAAMNALHEAMGQGHRVLFLTSTEAGLSCYKHEIPASPPLWDSGEIEITQLNQHLSERGFTHLTRIKRFQIFELQAFPRK